MNRYSKRKKSVNCFQHRYSTWKFNGKSKILSTLFSLSRHFHGFIETDVMVSNQTTTQIQNGTHVKLFDWHSIVVNHITVCHTHTYVWTLEDWRYTGIRFQLKWICGMCARSYGHDIMINYCIWQISIYWNRFLWNAKRHKCKKKKKIQSQYFLWKFFCCVVAQRPLLLTRCVVYIHDDFFFLLSVRWNMRCLFLHFFYYLCVCFFFHRQELNGKKKQFIAWQIDIFI